MNVKVEFLLFLFCRKISLLTIEEMNYIVGDNEQLIIGSRKEI